jgi:hypothetical protein
VCETAWDAEEQTQQTLTEETETDCRLRTYETAKKLNCTHVDRVNIMRHAILPRKKRCTVLRINEDTSSCKPRKI